MKRLKPKTIEFINKLLANELKAEYIMDNPNPHEVEYVEDLISASRDFASCMGDWTDSMYVEDLIEQIG